MNISKLQAIDTHGHYGAYHRGADGNLANRFMSGDATEVVQRAHACNIAWTIASPLTALLPRGGGDAFAGNLEAADVVSRTPGLLQYVVIDPRDDRTFQQAAEMLQTPKCVGIKIHPEEHCYPIREYGGRIFEFAATHRAVVLTHSSEQNSLAAEFIPLANAFPEVRLILAHIGCGWDGDMSHQVRAILQSTNDNVFADTSSSMSITPRLIEWAVEEVGAERVLFGTDTPLYSASTQRARIEYAELSDEHKQMILRDNARRIFSIPDDSFVNKERN